MWEDNEVLALTPIDDYNSLFFLLLLIIGYFMFLFLCQFIQADSVTCLSKTLTLTPLPQKTPSVTTPQIIWERPSRAIRQAGCPELRFGRWLGLRLWLRLGLQQTQQHTVPPRGAAETAEGRGGRYRPETSEDPRQINGSPLLACSPACQSACLCGLVSWGNPCGWSVFPLPSMDM